MRALLEFQQKLHNILVEPFRSSSKTNNAVWFLQVFNTAFPFMKKHLFHVAVELSQVDICQGHGSIFTQRTAVSSKCMAHFDIMATTKKIGLE